MDKGDAVDINTILFSHGFAQRFPKDVLSEASIIPDKADRRRFRGRRDLRGEKLFTIDGENAKDIDDAVSIELLNMDGQDCHNMPVLDIGGQDCQKNPALDADTGNSCLKNGIRAKYKLGVHIADVSAYVPIDSALDREALRRGTSLYYANRVIPMLPKKLSNGICSLQPHEDRLAISVYMFIDENGEILTHEIYESVINSARRMTYENVFRMLKERDAALCEQYSDVLCELESMRELSELMKANRVKRGALDFELRECSITLGADGVPLTVEASKTTFADGIIEEFMIACNETIAKTITAARLPFIYRTHGFPKKDKLVAFFNLAKVLGFSVPKTHGSRILRDDKKTLYALASILNKARGGKYEKLISFALLRSLDKAGYTAANTGHFGLASECYCHFTAPIRRYPDLLAHRIVKCYLKNGRMPRALRSFFDSTLAGVSAKCSERERAADETEREIEALKKAEYMQQYLGSVYEGLISGVTSFGLFVELENTVEGLVRVADMHDDYYHYDETRYTLTGEKTKKSYGIGDTVKVVLVRVNAEKRQIDFVLHEHTVLRQKLRRRQKRRRH